MVLMTYSSQFAPGAIILRDRATDHAPTFLSLIDEIIQRSPLRRVVTPSGKSMSVEMTSCGTFGWVSDRRGYRYAEIDPVTGTPWPAMPQSFVDFVESVASEAGYPRFLPDVCLINRYTPGSSMGLHQDRDERDFLQPIVSVSLGLSIRFRMGGTRRGGKTASTVLHHGDVVVFGGSSRLAFHGVAVLRDGFHPLTGNSRFNLTFRRAF
jgi:alkylated DNA repair protein (DNA oxidative demethylase)